MVSGPAEGIQLGRKDQSRLVVEIDTADHHWNLAGELFMKNGWLGENSDAETRED